MTFELRRFHFGLGDVITTVTNQREFIDKWICNVAGLCPPPCLQVVVGWALETRSCCPSGVATLQLCVGSRCIIIQLLHLDENIPDSLLNFLARPNTICVGMVEKKEEEELLSKYGIKCVKTADIRVLGMKFMSNNLRQKSRLQTLANRILQLQVPKPNNITLSNWEVLNLYPHQIEYACLDAYACYHIGDKLI